MIDRPNLRSNHGQVEINKPTDFASKLESRHVTSIVKAQTEKSERDDSYRLSKDSHVFWAFVIVLIFILAVLFLLLSYDKTEHLDAIIASLVAFAGGIGIGKWQQQKQPP